MRTPVVIIALMVLHGTVIAQQNFKWNLDLEEGYALEIPDGWIPWGGFALSRDSTESHSGTYSGLVSNENATGFGSIAFPFDAIDGTGMIKLTGWIKAEGVQGGNVGLILRVDGDNGAEAFDNMLDQGINGTFDWTQYSIELIYPPGAKRIFIGGIMNGTGKAWFDDFEVTIGGKDVRELTFKSEKPVTADLDTEFENGSGISFDALTDLQRQGLFRLCKVWGLVKYRHPSIANGDINWDYELYRIMSQILGAESNLEQDAHMADWLGQFPIAAPERSSQAPQGDLKLEAPTGWVDAPDQLSDDLSQYLNDILNVSTAAEHHQLAFAPGVGNPMFQNEAPVREMQFTDAGARMLALFRYWNMIEYFFPYRHLMDMNWDDVLIDFIPKMAAADDELRYKLTLLELIGKVQDTHANIWQSHEVLSSFWGLNHVPVRLQYIEDQFVVTEVRDEVKGYFEVGDVILSIDDESMDDIAEALKPHSPASNAPTQYRNICRRIMRTNEATLDINYKRDGKTQEIRVPTFNYESTRMPRRTEVSHKLVGGNIGYIFPEALERDEIHTIMETFAETDGLIVDLRCYPSDFIVFKLGGYLMPESTDFVKFTSGNLNNPGEFRFTKALAVGSNNADFYDKPVVIIINETTQSQAEYTTMALRVAPKATVIGSTTAGADGNVSRIVLPGNVTTMISGIGVYYPDGTETQRIGIVPDIEVHPSIAGIRAGQDELLQKAISIIEQHK